jgi:hypothetical protein
MQATHPNVFALKNSGVEAFLHADVGEELNGSTLTILSMIARLGPDPWSEAARWAALPRAGAIESLAESIDQMPLVPSALAEAHATATRLVQLLPTTTPGARLDGLVKTEASAMPNWLPVTLLYGAMALGMAVSGVLASKPSQAVVATTEQPMGTSGADAVSPVHAGPVNGVATAPFASLQKGMSSP